MTKFERGFDKLHYERFLYSKNKTYNNVIYWNCEWKRKKFNGRLTSSKKVNNSYFISASEHCHTPNADRIEISNINVRVKDLAKITRQNPSQIIRITTTNTSACLAPSLPSKNALKKLNTKNVRQSLQSPQT